MSTTSYLQDLRPLLDSPITARPEEGRQAVHPKQRRAAANPVRRWNSVTVGFWLGGVVLGTAGCLYGACQPYSHPVAVTTSALWWGIYFGTFGCWLGATIGTLTKRTPNVQSAGTNKEGTASD
jgi:hypothetical protein